MTRRGQNKSIIHKNTESKFSRIISSAGGNNRQENQKNQQKKRKLMKEKNDEKEYLALLGEFLFST